MPGRCADLGAYALTGENAGTLQGRKALAGEGAYALTGINAGVPLSRVAIASLGAFTVTAIASSPLLGRRIGADLATVTISGVDVSVYAGFYLRPDGTLAAGSWTTELGGTDLHNSIDEVTADDADYIQSASAPSADTAEVSMTNPAFEVAEPVYVRYRYKRDSAAQQIDLTVRLMEGASVRAEWTHTNISTSYVTAEQTLSAAQFASVTNWNSVSTRFIATAV
jgi:hypothetical protein